MDLFHHIYRIPSHQVKRSTISSGQRLAMSSGQKVNHLTRSKDQPSHQVKRSTVCQNAEIYKTGVNLELLSDPDMLLMVQESVRGGVSMCTKRHARAYNKYMIKFYNPNKPSRYLLYIDANSLNPCAMSCLLSSI